MPAKTIEMVVSLKVPDTTAITALQTLQRLGFGRLTDVKRSFYYKFLIDGSAEDFKSRISKVDILVNANKHFFAFSMQKNVIPGACIFFVLVKNIDDDGVGLLSTLKNRLGFSNLKKAESAVVWGLLIDANEKEARKIAEKAAKDLLANENYQEYTLI